MGCCCGGNRAAVRSMGQRELPQGAARTELSIKGMSCGSCVARIERALSGLEGVYRADVKVGSAEVALDPSRVSEVDLARAVESAGYEVAQNGAVARSAGCCCC